MELSLRSITAHSVAGFNFTDDASASSSSRNSTGSKSWTNNNNVYKDVRPQSGDCCQTPTSKRSIAIQTDNYFYTYPSSSASSPTTDQELDQEEEQETEDMTAIDDSTTDCNNSEYNSELENINYAISAIFTNEEDEEDGEYKRVDGPNAEMMVVGHRLTSESTPQNLTTVFASIPKRHRASSDSQLVIPGNNRGDSVAAGLTADGEPPRSFVVLPPRGIPKPKARPRQNMGAVILDYYHGTSPPSSEITVPSDNLSDVSTINSSLMSTPNSAKYALIGGGAVMNGEQSHAYKSAFVRISPPRRDIPMVSVQTQANASRPS